MKKFLYMTFLKFRNLVERRKKIVVIVYCIALIILFFSPHLTHTALTKENTAYPSPSYFTSVLAIKLIPESIEIMEHAGISISNYQIIMWYITPLLRILFFLSLIIIGLTFYFKKKKLVFSFVLIFIDIVYKLLFNIINYKGIFGTVANIGFYLITTLFLINLTYFITSIYFKRHPEYVPADMKEKVKKLSDKERIALLEKQVEELTQKSDK